MIDLVDRLRAPSGGVVADTQIISAARQAADEIEELRRQLGGGCDANYGGDHTVITQGKYRFCEGCGESLKSRVTRYVHDRREPLTCTK